MRDIMKKTVFTLAGLLTLPAFAAVLPAQNTPDQLTQSTARSATSRAMPSGRVATGATSRGAQRDADVASGRNAATRTTALHGVVSNAPDVTTRRTQSRAVASERTIGNVTRRVADNLDNVPTTSVNTGRVATRRMVGGIPAMPTRTTVVARATADVAAAPVAATASRDELAATTDFCKTQYMACMDNYCNVLDENQGRCSCSANLKSYEKTENALKQATASLQEVSQKIQYIGLSADDIETLFTQTAAEAQMQATSDNTQLKNDLDKIKKLIVDVKTGTATSSESTITMDLSGLLDFNVSTDGFDLNALFGNTSSGTGSINNQRGEQLYKTAAARCKASVLDSCEKQGVNIGLITNAYDLEIDKQCLAYEHKLVESNDRMSTTVRNAQGVLQRARLMVAQQKNSLDLRGCITELDACMQNEFVCGDDYENCLDPTGRYIINGNVVIGSQPGVPGGDLADAKNVPTSSTKTANLYRTWNYSDGDSSSGNAYVGNGTISEYITKNILSSSTEFDTPQSTNLAKYLQTKIGYHNDSTDTNHGLCVYVLNKCQDYTYTGNGMNTSYNFANGVIRDYLQRTLPLIKQRQDQILADYAEECIADVKSCMNQNKYGTSPETAIQSCKPQLVTCYSVNGEVNINGISAWAHNLMREESSMTTTELWKIAKSDADLLVKAISAETASAPDRVCPAKNGTESTTLTTISGRSLSSSLTDQQKEVQMQSDIAYVNAISEAYPDCSKDD